MGNKQITPQRQLQAILRNDFKSFVIKVFQTVSNDTYLDNWHVDVVCNEIEKNDKRSKHTTDCEFTTT